LKVRRSQIESIINLLLYSFKHDKNLPFTIPTKTCPDLQPSKNFKSKKCKKRHSEIIIQSYNEEIEKFHLLYYGVHNPKIVAEFDQEEQLVKSLIKKSLQKKKFAGKTLLEIRSLKKILKKTDIERKLWLTFRLSPKEKKMLQSKAKTRELAVSDFIRMKLFS